MQIFAKNTGPEIHIRHLEMTMEEKAGNGMGTIGPLKRLKTKEGSLRSVF